MEKVPTSRYSGIPPSLFYCHVCKKHMWDDNVCIMDFIFLCLHFKHLYFYVFILNTGLLFTGWLFAFISVIPESFERKNTPVDDG